jgi:RNA polymerase sigma-70 factor (ECF subfamily)
LASPLDVEQTQALLARIEAGDSLALDRLLAESRDYLRRVVELRMDSKMRARLDPSDVVQEAQVEIARRIGEFLSSRPMPFHLWLRRTAQENLLRLRRQHVEAGCRTVEREVPLPEGSSAEFAAQVLGRSPGPLSEAAQRELARRLRQAVEELPDLDREILLMRNFEGLNNQEVCQVLGLETATASKRYGRAILRLRQALVAGGISESEA